MARAQGQPSGRHATESPAYLRLVLNAVAVSAVYFAGAKVGSLFRFHGIPTSIFWLPNATMLAVFLLAAPRRWLAYVAAALVAHVACFGRSPMPASTMLLVFLTNVADGAIAALAIRRFGGAPRFDSFRKVVVFLLFATVAPFVVSFLDAAVMVGTGWASGYWLVWHTRFRSNILTNLIWVPPIVIALTRGRAWLRASSPRRYAEAAALALALALVATFVFGVPRSDSGIGIAFLYAPLPLFLWAAARFGTGGVGAALLGFAGLVIWHATQGRGPLSSYPAATNVLTLQVFLTLLAATLLLLSTLLQDQRAAQDALRDGEAQYRSIFEATTDGVLITDLQHGVVAANPAFRELTGYSAASLSGTHPRSFFHLDDLRPFDEYLSRVSGGEASETCAMCVRGDGGFSHVEIHGRPFSYGGRSHVLSVVRDVTEREEAFRLLERRVAERTHALSTLLEISSTLASTLELRPLLRVALEQLQMVVEYTGATIFVEESEHLVILDHRGPLAAAQASQVRIPAAQAGGHPMLGRKSPLIIDDVWSDSPTARAFRASMPEAVTTLYGYARSVMIVPLQARDRAIGFLRIDSAEPNRYALHDAQLALALANQAAVAIENARLYDQARELAAFEERQRLARELHDSVTQTLYAAAMLGEVLPSTWLRDQAQGRASLANLQEMTRTALAEMRTLLLELRPATLLQASLGDLLRQLVAALRARVEVPILVDVDGTEALPPDVHVNFYRIAQEALSNITRHAGASTVHIGLSCSDASATLTVRDDGVGFQPVDVSPDSLGLQIVRERAGAIGATLSIDSAVGRGTTITVHWSKGATTT